VNVLAESWSVWAAASGRWALVPLAHKPGLILKRMLLTILLLIALASLLTANFFGPEIPMFPKQPKLLIFRLMNWIL
jgi:hypothetical protein